MKSPLRYLLLGAGVIAAAVLLFGQAHPNQVIYQPPMVGRYQMERSPDGREVFVIDTVTGEVRRILTFRPANLPSDLGKPFESLPRG